MLLLLFLVGTATAPRPFLAEDPRLLWVQLRYTQPTSPTRAQPADPWLAYDKVQHAAISFLWTLSTQYALVQKIGWAEQQALPLAAGGTALVGVGKELYDWKVGATRRFSYRDLVANGVGILLAVGFILL